MKAFQSISHLIKSQPITRVQSHLFSQKSIYIGNLPFNLKRKELEEIVGQYGAVYQLNYPMDPFGRYKGMAFVNYESSQAEIAFKKLSGSKIKGRDVKIGWAFKQPKKEANQSIQQLFIEDGISDMIATKLFEKIEMDAKNKK